MAAASISQSSDNCIPRTIVGEQSQATTVSLQEHHYIENYFTAGLWGMLGGEAQINDKLVAVAVFVIDRLGLHYFAEKTAVSIVGVVLAAHGKPMTYHEAHDHLRTFKKCIKERRNLGSSASVVLTYPQSVFEFVRLCPGRYSPSDPPVKCPLTRTAIASGRSLMSRGLDYLSLHGEAGACPIDVDSLPAPPDYRLRKNSVMIALSQGGTGKRFPIIVPYLSTMLRCEGYGMEDGDDPMRRQWEKAHRIEWRARRRSRSVYRSTRSSTATSENVDPATSENVDPTEPQ